MELTDRIALVTGGGHRVGRALSLALARAGAHVVVNYHASRAQADETVEQIRSLGRRALAVKADVGNVDEIKALFNAVDGFGSLDILVNSASPFPVNSFLDISEEEYDLVLNVTLKGSFFCAQEAARRMLGGQGGKIINMADIAAYQAWPSQIHHSIAKAGVVMLTKALARALGPTICVNGIAPGAVLLPEDYDPQAAQKLISRTPLGRLGSPQDVAKTLLFLLESDYITGTVVVVDGGRLVV